jgi:hypothetical protein
MRTVPRLRNRDHLSSRRDLTSVSFDESGTTKHDSTIMRAVIWIRTSLHHHLGRRPVDILLEA